MKIKLIHSAQVVDGKHTKQHPPGTELKTDHQQGTRLVVNGYATEVNEQDVVVHEKPPVGGGNGTGEGGAG